jgi:GT2 family glycosyltransferase
VRTPSRSPSYGKPPELRRRPALRVQASRQRARPLRSRLPSASVIVPFHRNLADLDRCLAALAPDAARWEIIVASDGAPESCDALAHRHGARVVHLPTSRGPAAARNRAAASATGEVLVFVDADVVVAPGAVAALLRRFAEAEPVTAIFGSYDDHPHAGGFFSQYKNLAHAFVHRSAAGDVPTFWSGFGGIRASAFRAIGGFDETYTRPCIEDIELGRRLTAHGHRVKIDPTVQACHLKRWTFVSMVRSDVRDRGIPWTRLILESHEFPSTLNIDRRSRASVALCWVGLITAALAAVVDSRFLIASALAMIVTLWMNRAVYRFFTERRGGAFAAGGAAVHVLYHLYNGVSFVIGAIAHFWTQWRGLARGSVGQRRLAPLASCGADVTSNHATPGTM